MPRSLPTKKDPFVTVPPDFPGLVTIAGGPSDLPAASCASVERAEIYGADNDRIATPRLAFSITTGRCPLNAAYESRCSTMA